MRFVICVPTVTKPHPKTLASIAAAVPILDKFGFEHLMVAEIGNAYISGARGAMLRKALDHLDPEKDAVLFWDHDVTARPHDVVKLMGTEGLVVAGTYRYKKDEVEYMGGWHTDEDGIPITRPSDGAIKASMVPAGFLKVRVQAIDRLMLAYPELCYGPPSHPSFDLFNHGAFERVWWGEDMAFCRRWAKIGGEIWMPPDMDIDHWGYDAKGKPKAWEGNLARYMRSSPGGDLDPNRPPAPPPPSFREQMNMRADSEDWPPEFRHQIDRAIDALDRLRGTRLAYPGARGALPSAVEIQRKAPKPAKKARKRRS